MSLRGTITTHESGVDFVVEWQIQGFTTLRKTDAAVHGSPDFSFDGERWFLAIFPNGASYRGTSGHVDLFLQKYNSGRSIRLPLSLSLKTAKGEKYREEHYTKDFRDWPKDSYVFNRFISRAELTRLSSDLLPDDVLTVVCIMKGTTSAGSESDSASDDISNSDSESDSAENSASDSVSDSAGCSSDSNECRHCKGNFAAGIRSSHQRKCEQRPVKCPDCQEVVVLQKFLNEHECHHNRPEAENSESNCVETSTQTEEENGEESENICVEAFTQTGEENADEWFKEKFKTACVDASTQTEEQNVSLTSLPEAHDLMTDFKDLLKEGRGIDVTFKVDTMDAKTEFFAHQLILALRSSYFADLFYGQATKKGHQIIPLTGINTKAFEQMIRYCYDYKPCLQTTEDACALFKVASEFKVISLRNLCHTFFRHTKIDPKNVFSILKISVEMEDQNLQDTCYNFLQEQTREIMAAYTPYDVTPAMVYTLLNLPKLSLNSEYELIKWICDWAKRKAEDTSSENAREYVVSLLKYMNFLTLTVVEFAILCKDNPELFSSDEIISIYQNIACPGTRKMPDWYDKDVQCRVYTGSNE